MSTLTTISNAALDALFDGKPPTKFYRHGRLVVIYTDHERHSLDEANATFGIRDWRHLSVSVFRHTELSLVDGHPPLPTWYELSHLVYGDHAEFTWDKARDVLQFLPPPSDYVNIAEALHLWQPR